LVASLLFIFVSPARRQNFVQLLMEDSDLRNQLFETHLKKVRKQSHASQLDLAQPCSIVKTTEPFFSIFR